MSVSVSIIVPCYNVAAYLDQCMESLAGQSMEDIEIICVNDGSSDHTAEILREWRDRDGRVRVIDRKNSGVSAARNSGMEEAAGKYIGFVDPDDVVERNMFRRLFDAAVEKDADVAVCGYHEFCDRGGMDMPESGWSPSAGFFPEEKAERFRRERGLLDSPAAFGLVDYCMELMRRHFIMKEGAFFRASPEDREVLLSGWKKWLELVGAENVLPRLDRWDRAFCRLLLDYPCRSNFFSALHSRLMSSRKGRRGAYYTLKRRLMK